MAPRGLVTAAPTRETPAAEPGPTQCTPVALQGLPVVLPSAHVDRTLATDEGRREYYSGELSSDVARGKAQFGKIWWV